MKGPKTGGTEAIPQRGKKHRKVPQMLALALAEMNRERSHEGDEIKGKKEDVN